MFHSLSSTSANDNFLSLQSAYVAPASSTEKPVKPRATGQTALSLSQLTTYRQSFVEDIELCRNAGIGRIGIWRRKLEDVGIDTAVHLLTQQKLSVSSVSWGGGFTGGNGYTFDEAVEETRTAIEQAARLGAHALTIVSGGRAGHIRSHCRRLLFDGLEATIEFADAHSVKLALQPMASEYSQQWTFLDSLAEAVGIVRGFNHASLGLAIGTSHVWGQPGGIELLEEAAPLIATVQLNDWRYPRRDDDQLLPGDGLVPLDEMLQALRRGGYTGDYELDVWSSRLWKSDPETWIDRCVDNCNRLIPLPKSHTPQAS